MWTKMIREENAVKTMAALTKNANGYVNDFLGSATFSVYKKIGRPGWDDQF